MTSLVPPVCEKKPHSIVYHNKTFVDDYFWLREKQNPQVLEYLHKENDYATQVLAQTEPLQEQLYKEFLGRLKEDDQTAPFKRGDYYYYRRTEAGKQYQKYCRRKGSMNGEEEVILDVNIIGEQHAFAQIGNFAVSPNNKFVAYSLDTSGDEAYSIYFKNLETGEVLPKVIPTSYYSLEWANDDSTIYFDTLDDIHRPYRVLRANIFDEKEPEIVYEEKDKKFEIKLKKTKSDKYIIIVAESFLSTENWYIDADLPNSVPVLIQQRESGVLYHVEHQDSSFLIWSDQSNKDNFQLYQTSITETDKKHWKELFPYDPEVFIDSVHPFEKFLVLEQRYNGRKRIRIHKADNLNEFHDIQLVDPICDLSIEDEQHFHSNILRYQFSSFTIPQTIFEYDMEKKTQVILKRKEVLGNYNPEEYVSENLTAKSHDGTEVPISLFYKKGLQKNGKNPTLLYGYGSYGISIDPAFKSERISYVDRGFVFAIAHIRGGGEKGRLWYKNGKFLKKKNTFLDFVSSAEALISNKFTSPDLLAIEGRSAGGLLISATLNLRPDLFKVAFLGVPFVDVVNTMMDETIPLTINEYDEWGNPNDKTFFDEMLSYSPYDNLPTGVKMPHMLIRAGINDQRVQYWEPSKYVAKLRTLLPQTDRKLLLKMEFGAGHFGVTGRYSYLKDIAIDYAFIIHFINQNQNQNQVD